MNIKKQTKQLFLTEYSTLEQVTESFSDFDLSLEKIIQLGETGKIKIHIRIKDETVAYFTLKLDEIDVETFISSVSEFSIIEQIKEYNSLVINGEVRAITYDAVISDYWVLPSHHLRNHIFEENNPTMFLEDRNTQTGLSVRFEDAWLYNEQHLSVKNLFLSKEDIKKVHDYFYHDIPIDSDNTGQNNSSSNKKEKLPNMMEHHTLYNSQKIYAILCFAIHIMSREPNITSDSNLWATKVLDLITQKWKSIQEPSLHIEDIDTFLNWCVNDTCFSGIDSIADLTEKIEGPRYESENHGRFNSRNQRITILIPAVYVKTMYPENCNKNAKWAREIDDKSQIWWPKEYGIPGVNLETVSKWLGRCVSEKLMLPKKF
ncbi:hypothetical protein P7F88_17750 [Vibrio hannami]|uniref:hypothetical protein n=1 Tax=Vibrio hannami TaxID=2717094 RepID=UPI00240F7AC2|nr:hypothetical protein [Vibrio hannami]MDG3087812.1 hypothetical protein [Vibrio hannami]